MRDGNDDVHHVHAVALPRYAGHCLGVQEYALEGIYFV